MRLCIDEIDHREAKQLDLRLRRGELRDQHPPRGHFQWSFNAQTPKARVIGLVSRNPS